MGTAMSLLFEEKLPDMQKDLKRFYKNQNGPL